MKYSLEYKSDNHNKIMSQVIGVGIDSPNTPLITGDDFFVFSGWIIPKFYNKNIKWVLEYSHRQEEIIIADKRPDVVAHFKALDIDVNLNCGFHKKVSLDNLNCLYISIDGLICEFITVKRIEKKFLNHIERNEITDSWLKIHDGKDLQYKSEELTFESISDFFKVVSIEDYAAFATTSLLQDQLLKRLNDNFNPIWPKTALDTYVEKGFLSIQGLNSDEDLVCKFSINVHFINFIYFESKSESLYLVQYCRNVAIIFPKDFLVVSEFVGADWVRQVLDKMQYFAKHLQDYAFKYSLFDRNINNAATFLGFNVSQPRPYHFFYDYFYGLFYIRDSSTVEADIFSVKKCDFWTSFDDFSSRFYNFDDKEINEHVLSLGGFLIMPCIEFSRVKDKEIFKNTAEFLMKKSNEKCLNLFSHLTTSEDDIFLWVGISSEKRCWIEQIDGFSNIFCELQKIFKNLTVFVDGRTFPANPSSFDFSNKINEDLIFNSLVESNPNVTFVNMIGMQSIEKLYFAQRVDFFISSYGTDSMYPSAICAKPGVVYVAPSIGDQKVLHSHYKIIEVPSCKVKEVYSTDHHKKAWHEISVSMDWRDVYSSVLQLIKTYEIRK